MQSQAAPSLSSAGAKLEARLALTRRYQRCRPPSLEESREAEQAYKDCASVNACQEQPNYKVTPPDLSLIHAAMEFVEAFTASSGYTSATDPTIASAVMMVLEDDCENQGFLLTQDSSGASDYSNSDRWIVTPRHLRSLISCLTQLSFQSWERQEGCRLERASNMAKAFASFRGGDQHMSLSIWNNSVEDAKAVACSHAFPDMLLGSTDGRHSSWEDRFDEDECTRGLLHMRLMLRCESFVVICQGADHMAAFMQLAKHSQLHLELLPSNAHLTQVRRTLARVEGDSPPVAYDMLCVVSCSPQNKEQAAMLETTPDKRVVISFDETARFQCWELAYVVADIRFLGGSVLIKSYTSDLPKVILALYTELLTSHQAVNLIVVDPQKQGQRHNTLSDDMELLMMLAARAVNPDDFQYVADSQHCLIVA